MKKQKGRSLTVCDEYINVRVSKRMKSILKNQADQQEKSLSDYIRYLIQEGRKKQKAKKELAQCLVLCQDIVGYIREKYDCPENEILVEMVDKAWEKLS